MLLDARLLFTCLLNARALCPGLLLADLMFADLLLAGLVLTLLLLRPQLPLVIFQLLVILIGVDIVSPSVVALMVRRAVDIRAAMTMIRATIPIVVAIVPGIVPRIVPVIAMIPVAVSAAPIGPVVVVGIGPPPCPVMEKRA
jgi:hypothetical protein